MVNQNCSVFPAPHAVAALVRGAEFDPVGAVSVDFRSNVTRRTGRQRQCALDHPLLVNMAIHQFNPMRMALAREPHRVSCLAGAHALSPFASDAAAAAISKFDGGAVGA